MFSSQRGSDLFRLKKIRDIFDWFLSRLFSADFSRLFCSEKFVEVWLKNPFSISLLSCLQWKGRELVIGPMESNHCSIFECIRSLKLFKILYSGPFFPDLQRHQQERKFRKPRIASVSVSGDRKYRPRQRVFGPQTNFQWPGTKLLRIIIRFNLVSLLNAAYQPSAQIAEKVTFAVVTVQ